jgi:acetyltransferase-like isoleucine patch superfamily enzyme
MDGARVGRHCNIGDHVFIESGATVGDRVTIKNGVMIFKGVTIEDDAFIGPGVIFTNDRHPRSPRMAEVTERYGHEKNWLTKVLVCRGATLGAGAVVLPGVSIGPYAAVGAGSVVTRDVAAHALVRGNPAKKTAWVCICGKPLPESRGCAACGRQLRNE